MFEIRIFIPICDNAGTVFSSEHHKVFEEEILNYFAGYTRLPARAAGAWKSPEGVTYLDHTMVYLVAVDTIGAGLSVRRIAEFAKAHYEQEGIYISYLGVSEVV